jgi:hypothetical protein
VQKLTTPALDSSVSYSVTVTGAGNLRHDEFSIVFFDQGCPLRSENTTCASPLNLNCPYHGVVLCLQLPSETPGPKRAFDATEHGLLVDMPPVSLTHKHQLGTAASCHCNCGQSQNGRNDLQPFLQDIDKVVGRFRAETSDLHN